MLTIGATAVTVGNGVAAGPTETDVADVALPYESAPGKCSHDGVDALFWWTHLSLRVLADFLMAKFGVYDDAGAFVAVSSNPNKNETVLWRNNKILISGMVEYFEVKWKTAVRFDQELPLLSLPR